MNGRIPLSEILTYADRYGFEPEEFTDMIMAIDAKTVKLNKDKQDRERKNKRR